MLSNNILTDSQAQCMYSPVFNNPIFQKLQTCILLLPFVCEHLASISFINLSKLFYFVSVIKEIVSVYYTLIYLICVLTLTQSMLLFFFLLCFIILNSELIILDHTLRKKKKKVSSLPSEMIVLVPPSTPCQQSLSIFLIVSLC